MSAARPQPPGIEVDATLVAHGLGMEPSQFRSLMQHGRIRSLCERGVGDDAGRFRLTFYYRTRRFRLVTDAHGQPIPQT